MPEANPTEAYEEPASVKVKVEEAGGVQVEEVSLGELWAKGQRAAPSMRILKRSAEFGPGYELVRELETEHRGRLRLGISTTERRVVSADSSGNIEVWQTRGSRVLRVNLGEMPFLEVGFVQGQDFIWALGAGGQVQLLEISEAERGPSARLFRAQIQGGVSFSSGCFVADQKLLLTGSPDGKARLWSLKEGKCLAAFADHEGALTAVVIGRRGPITASVDGHIRFWNRQGALVDQLQSKSPVVGLIAQKGLVGWVQADGGLSILREGQSQPAQLAGHQGAGRALVFREDGFFISGGEDGRLLIYDGAQEKPVQEIRVPAPVHDLAVSERVLAVACEGGKIFLFRRESKKP